MKIHRLSDRLAVSGALTEDELRDLPALGYRSVLDLRSDGEPRPQGMAPWDEATLARRIGLAHRQIPVEPQLLHDTLGHAVRHAVAVLPAPVLLHCTTGRRAGTFGLALLACDEGLDVAACLERGRKMGLDFEGMPRLTAFLREFVGRYAQARRGPSGGGERSAPSI
jgi:uncharacterized protein (TIGR01244 family)